MLTKNGKRSSFGKLGQMARVSADAFDHQNTDHFGDYPLDLPYEGYYPRHDISDYDNYRYTYPPLHSRRGGYDGWYDYPRGGPAPEDLAFDGTLFDNINRLKRIQSR